MELIEAYVYIFHLDKKFNIPVTPDQIQNQSSIQFSQESILGRSAPQVTFSSAGPRTQNVQLVLHRQLFALENNSDENAVDDLINALAACALPTYNSDLKAIVPPSLLIRFGNESCIEGVLQSDIQVISSGPWLKNGKMAQVTITFNVLEVQPFSADYAYQNGFLRSISTDLSRSSIWKY